jgi:hypothetical protein
MQLARNNIMSLVLGMLGVVGMATGNGSLPLLALTIMHIFDTMQGMASSDESRTEYLNTGNARDQAGPIARFFLDSWRTDSFNRKDYMTC